MPSFSAARTDSADLTDIQPAEYRADNVTILVDEKGTPVMGIIVEVQLKRDDRKRFVWLSYVANLRSRWECPVCLLVVTLDRAVARWAAKEIEFGCGYTFAPLVLGPDQIEKVTDVDQAFELPERAVLSAMAHGRSADIELAAKIGSAALCVCAGLEAEKSQLYVDLIYASLSEAATREIKTMPLRKHEYISDFARGYVAQGREEGRTEGRADVIRQLLTMRFGEIGPEFEGRIKAASLEELSGMGERILIATSLDQVFTAR